HHVRCGVVCCAMVSRNVDRRPQFCGLGELPISSRQHRKLRASEVRLAAEMRALAAATRRRRRRLLYGMFATAAVVVALSMAIFSGGSTTAGAGGGKLIAASASSRSLTGATGSGLTGQALQ